MKADFRYLSQDFDVSVCSSRKPSKCNELINKKYKKYSTEFILFK